VTPTSYLELLLTYKMLLGTERVKTLRLRAGYDRGVEKLLSTAEEVAKMQRDIEEKQPLLAVMTQETDVLMVQIEKEQREVVAPRQVLIQQEEAVAAKQASEAQAIKTDCDTELALALPILRKAQTALNTIKSQHFYELRVLGKPPGPVRMVLHAVCVLCQRKAERTPKKEDPQVLEDNWWLTAQRFMSEKNFLQGLLDFDKDHIPEAVMRKIRQQFMTDADFRPERVAQASFAAKGLCQWVRALDQYDQVLKMVGPKRARAAAAEASYRVTLDGLAAKQADLRGIIEQFEAVQARLDETKRRRVKLEEDINDCEQKLGRAKALLEGLGGEEQRWKEASLALEGHYNALVGDCLVAAATIVYLAPVPSEIRGGAAQTWARAAAEQGLETSADYSFQRLLGEPVTLRHWAIAGLPTDAFSVDNAIMAARARRWPLMIDPQGQASRWIKSIEGSTRSVGGGPPSAGRLAVLKPADADVGRRLEHCIQLGLPALLEGVGEQLDPLLEPLLDQRTVKSAGGLTLTLGDVVLDYSPDFLFFMTTKLANPHFLPEVSTRVTLINFVITFEGLTEQLLDLVVRKENAALDEERQAHIQTTFANKKAQRDVEQSILELLRASQGNILDDEKAIDALGQSQRLAHEIELRQASAAAAATKLDEARRGYSAVAHDCGLLFFLVSKLVLADPMYQYSLNWFLVLFSAALENFRKPKAAEVEEEGENEEVAEEVVEVSALAEYFTHSLYTNVCRSLFEKDKLLFAFLLTAKQAQARGAISASEFALLTEVEEGDEDDLGSMPAECKGWLPPARWLALCQMAPESEIIRAALLDFGANASSWRAISASECPLREQFPPLAGLPGEAASRELDNFTKLCLVKALAPGSFIPAAREYILLERGQQYLNPPLFDLERSFDDSTWATPLIFLLPGADPL
jgi:dynein heavy chain